jgi:hypothetical protein
LQVAESGAPRDIRSYGSSSPEVKTHQQCVANTTMMSAVQTWATPHRLTSPAVWRGIISLLLLASLSSVATLKVAAQAPNEYRVKAAFILNFARFIEWPADGYGDGGSLVVGIIGDDPFGGSLDQLNGNTVNGHRIVIKRLKPGDYLRSCQVLFVSSSERNQLGKILESVRGSSVLTIGELPHFNQAGGIIKFVIQDNKVRFEINDGAASQARLRISSKLLALSRSGKN